MRAIITCGLYTFYPIFEVQKRLFNIVSGSDANITTPCEMEIFNFLWLIWDHYIPLAPTLKDRPP